MGNFGNVVDIMYPLFGVPPGTIPHAHNLFLQIAVDLGILGLVSWLSIFFIVVLLLWQTYKRGRVKQNGWITGLSVGMLCSQLALAVHGMVDAVTWGMVKPAPIVWGLWGIAVAIHNITIFLMVYTLLLLP